MPTESAKKRIRERREKAVQPEPFLKSVGAIKSVDGNEQLALTDSFRAAVQDQVDVIHGTDVSPADIADLFGVPESDVEHQPHRTPNAFKIIHTVRHWSSREALELDLSMHAVLKEMTDRWTELPGKQRYRILRSLRGFQDQCFFCDGTVAVEDELVESCCADYEVFTFQCSDCGRRFMELTPDEPTTR